VQFGNMDKLVEHINKNPRFGCAIRYSTASEYFAAVYKTKAEYPLFESDFFPYADNGDSFWTGYYTTRPFLKIMARKVDAELHAADQLFALARMDLGLSEESGLLLQRPSPQLDVLYQRLLAAHQNAGLFLHHDGITGTARKQVNEDYMRRMHEASNDLGDIMVKSSELLLSRHSFLHIANTALPAGTIKTATAAAAAATAPTAGAPSAADVAPTASLAYGLGTLSSIPDGKVVQGNNGVNPGRTHPVVLYNPLAWPRRELVTLVVTTPFVTVVHADGTPLLAQLEALADGEDDGSGTAVNTGTYLIFFFAFISCSCVNPIHILHSV
jgi:hypothetical protein